MRDIIAAIVTAVFASTILFFWYHEMFSDGPVGEFSRSFDSGRGKNFTALTQPVFIVLNISASMMLMTGVFTSRSAREVARMNSPWRVWALFWAIMCILALLVLAISFIPFSLPEWMYPEYHAARREERRGREAAEHGEAKDRDPFLDDNGVYASQLGNVPVDIPEAVGLPSTGDPHTPQTAPSAEDPPAPHGAPETGAPALHSPDAAPAPPRGHRRRLRHHSHRRRTAPHRGTHQPRHPPRPRIARTPGPIGRRQSPGSAQHHGQS
mgnify:CR=1 FL=1